VLCETPIPGFRRPRILGLRAASQRVSHKAHGLGIYKIDPTGMLSKFATDTAELMSLGLVALTSDAAGNVYASGGVVVIRFASDGAESIVVGTGDAGFPVAGPAASSRWSDIMGLAVDEGGNLYIVDQDVDIVGKADRNGRLSILAHGSVLPPIIS